MNILFLSSGATVPSARFRILPYLRHFQADGHRCYCANSFPQKYDYFPWMGFRPSQLLKRSVRWWHWVRAKLSAFDIVFIDREIFDNQSLEMEERFREACGKMVVDIDDAIFLRCPEKFDCLMKMADLVICGNHFLMDRVRPLNDQLLHIPTCVDLDDYEQRPLPSVNEVPVVGWIGTTGNLKYLQVPSEALREVAGKVPFELRVIVPDISPLSEINLSGVNLVHQRWDPSGEVQQIQQMDVGLMPLFANQEWDIYKCGLKLIQYLAVGVPAIAAPVGVNSEIIDNQQNGFTAQTTEEWQSALLKMLSDPSMRNQMGLRGRRTVQEKYSILANYPILRDRLLELAATS
ncbi:glycosyltransferase [Rubripirellula reticaptiva]|uniref:Glycosyl transferases group 1 n=1 Tax=Rubripirellula reticaptiva TaxID=2528013 RepID=A0A5C6F7H7_9BACT|nr:glycosyltransferase [Rubripirellula reticaptiva]TWU55729.1 Glycosyl transferases group 1 [Rubripirellula reticaptiva]